MTSITVFEIQKDLISSLIEKRLRSISKFYDVFDDKVLIILVESFTSDVFIEDIVDRGDIMVESYTLNSFARSRLINNFEKERPELSFILLGCTSESRLIKIWKTNAK